MRRRDVAGFFDQLTALGMLALIASNPKAVKRLVLAEAEATADVLLWATGTRWQIRRRKLLRRWQRFARWVSRR